MQPLKNIVGSLLFALAGFPLAAVEPNDVIINEVYYATKGPETFGHSEAVELLVVADKVNLNSLRLSDRDIWNKPSEGVCTLADLGQGFLSAVRSGTLVVIYSGEGVDDSDPSDFVLRFHARSSLFCNTTPSTNAFEFSDHEDNLHLLRHGKQIDYIKYRASNATKDPCFSGPGFLEWENGREGYIPIGEVEENVGIRFLGNKPELNSFPAAWQAYPESDLEVDNLGAPNGGANTTWIEQLRKKALAIEALSSDEQKRKE